MPRSMRMRRPAEFQGVRSKGKSTAGKHLALACLRDESLQDFRFGFVTSKRVGNAVARNRVRRRLRAIARREGSALEPGHWIVSIARKGAAEASFDELHREWKALARRLGILKRDGEDSPQGQKIWTLQKNGKG